MSDNNIGFVPLPLTEVGFVSLTGGDSPTPPIPTKPSEAILAAMPTAMRESLVCWYQPKVQLADDNMTVDEFNELLNDNYPTYADGLRDLSGNGYDMTLYYLDGESGGYVNEDGDLVCDSYDDYGTSQPVIDSFAFTALVGGRITTNGCFMSNTNASTGTETCLFLWGGSNSSNYINGSPEDMSYLSEYGAYYITNLSNNGTPTTKTKANRKYDWLTLNDTRPLRGRRGGAILGSFVLFSRVLDYEEIEWVKTIIINYNNN